MYDTKVSAYRNKHIFAKNALGDLFEFTENSEKFKGVVGFKFDEKHEMIKYMPPKPKEAPAPEKPVENAEVVPVLAPVVPEVEKPTVEQKIEKPVFKAKPNSYHEAAYDAFITGVCFARILKYL